MSSKPTLNGLNLVVANMEESLAFYRRLGVDIPEQTVWRSESGRADHVEANMPDGIGLDLDSEPLAAAYNAGWSPESPRCLVGFSVDTRDDVDAHYMEMTAAGYKGLQQPYDAFWGARYAIIEDPDGNQIGLMSPVDDEHRSEPPAL